MEGEEFIVRASTDHEGLVEIEELQMAIWGSSSREIVPASFLADAQRNGAMVLVAFDNREGKAIGFLFGFLGLENGRPKYCSHMIGVLPDYRNRGVGHQLKRDQRGQVLSLGINLVTWTFDPLLGANASLDFRKLGGISRAYQREIYGPKFETLGYGLPTDGLVVEWWIASSRVVQCLGRRMGTPSFQRLLDEGAVLVNRSNRKGDLLEIVDYDTNLTNQVLLVEIPEDIRHIQGSDVSIATDWCTGTRSIFESYFANHYVIVDFFSEKLGTRRRNFYVLKPATGVLLEV